MNEIVLDIVGLIVIVLALLIIQVMVDLLIKYKNRQIKRLMRESKNDFNAYQREVSELKDQIKTLKKKRGKKKEDNEMRYNVNRPWNINEIISGALRDQRDKEKHQEIKEDISKAIEDEKL